MASVEREELTQEERKALLNLAPGWDTHEEDAEYIRKVLRLLDAHAADRAALVAQLEEMRGLLRRHKARLYWHEDPMLYDDTKTALSGQPEPRPEEDAGPDGEADPDYPPHREHFAPTHAALVAQLAELTRELGEARAEAERWRFAQQTEAESRAAKAESECAALRLQLEAARGVAESECAALRAEVERLRGNPDIDFPDSPPNETDRQAAVRWYKRCDAVEARLAAANAVLERINRCGGLGLDVYEWINDYFAAQPATAPALKHDPRITQPTGTSSGYQPATAPARDEGEAK